MSMTQIAFVKKADLPTREAIQSTIVELGHKFEFVDEFDTFDNLDGIECKINDYPAYLELYFEPTSEVLKEYLWLQPEITEQDTAISFVWGADFAAGACIGLICIALIDHCDALIYYMDDEMKYSREMLVADTPQFLTELEKQPPRPLEDPTQVANATKSKSILEKLKDMFK